MRYGRVSLDIEIGILITIMMTVFMGGDGQVRMETVFNYENARRKKRASSTC